MMHRLKHIVVLGILLLIYQVSQAQSVLISKDEAVENVIEYLSENDEDNIDFDELSSNLSMLYDNPLNLNTCTDEELSALHLFSPIIVMNILDYRKNNNGFVTLYELKLISGLNNELIFLAIPFLTTPQREKYSPKITFKNLGKMGRHSLITRYQRVLEDQRGYLKDDKGETKYMGSPDKVYTKYQYRFSDKIKAGFTLEKDAGEPFFKDPNKQGFDFMSGFVQLKNQGIIKSLVAGDYSLQFGQGLALWNGFGMRKSSMTTNVTKFGKGVDKYSSTDENRFFRGIATSLQYKRSELSLFFSSKKIDGNIDRDTLYNEIDEFTSFNTTGLHNTQSAFDRKHTIGETVYGATYTHHFKRLKLGATSVFYQYSVPLQTSEKLYKKYDFSGDKNFNSSIFYQWNLNHIFLAGELASDQYGNIAITNHAVFNVSTKVGVVLLHRYFDKEYKAVFASGFSEGSKVQNETGFYAGLQFLPTRNLTVKAYVDYYQFPWLRYQLSSPLSSGLDYMLIGEYSLSSNFGFYIKYKNETRPKDVAIEGEALKHQLAENKQQLRVHLDYGDKGRLRFKTRAEWSWYSHKTDEKGFLAYQDIIYQWKKIPLRSTLRFLVFDTDGYNSRIYTYENEVLYNFAIPAFADQGLRTYVLLKYSIFKNLDFWLKYGITVYSDKQTVGSGYNEIEGNSKSEIKLQLRFKF